MIKNYIESETKQINIWPGFVDIMSFTLFTVLLIFIISFVRYQYLDYLVGKGEEDIREIMGIFSDSAYKVENGRIIIQESILFDFDSDILKKEGQVKLKTIGAKLSSFLNIDSRKDKFSIIIEGHTDAVGSDRYNLSLSFRRAKAVTDYWDEEVAFSTRLDENVDILPAGYGETRMIIPTANNIKNSENRRIEIRIVPKFNKMLEGWFGK